MPRGTSRLAPEPQRQRPGREAACLRAEVVDRRLSLVDRGLRGGVGGRLRRLRAPGLAWLSLWNAIATQRDVSSASRVARVARPAICFVLRSEGTRADLRGYLLSALEDFVVTCTVMVPMNTKKDPNLRRSRSLPAS